ncbi:MAG: EDSAP-1 family PEP-CTERM protein [Halioglobus sp.]
MKLGKNKLAVALGAALAFGMAGQASADVYGLSSVQIDGLTINITGVLPGSTATLFSFDTNQDAILNGVADGSDGSASCGGLFGGANDCGAGNPRLSGTVQNAPGSTLARGENDYTAYGQTGQYSNSEAAIITATLLGDPATSTGAISESNLQSGTSAQANTNVGSNTLLTLNFELGGDGGFAVSFDAVIDVLSQVTGGDIGIAQANSGVTVVLQKDGQTLASWAPTGTNNVTTCSAGLTCVATESALSLNNTTSSSGAANQVAGSGSYMIDVQGLTSGQYTLALANTTSTNLRRVHDAPIPGTLLLMGTGLLVGARSLRRKK